MNINFTAVIVAALVPMIMGFIWYNKNTFGNIWMKEADISEEKMKSANMGIIFGVSFIMSVFLAFSLQFAVIHQFHFSSMLFKSSFNDPSTELGMMYKSIMNQFGSAYRTFKHGALHGTMTGIFMATPLVAINSLFERKSVKYILIHSGYWILCMGIMGGILSAWM